MKFKAEKYRIFISRIAIAFGIFVLCSTQSYWDKNDEPISFLLFLIGIIFVAIASLGRMWCSVYIAGYKDNKLITAGPYSLCRNPLYFFSMLGVIGIGCATETITFPLIFIVLFSIYYPFVIKSEEKRLREIFGSDFDEYISRVPAFFPKLSNFHEPADYIVNPSVYRRHIFSALWFIWIVGLLEVVEGLKEIGWFNHLWMLY